MFAVGGLELTGGILITTGSISLFCTAIRPVFVLRTYLAGRLMVLTAFDDARADLAGAFVLVVVRVEAGLRFAAIFFAAVLVFAAFPPKSALLLPRSWPDAQIEEKTSNPQNIRSVNFMLIKNSINGKSRFVQPA